MRSLIAVMLGLVAALGLAALVFFSATKDRDAPDRPLPAVDERADRAAIHERIRAMQDANNAGDVAAWVDGFAPDAVYMAPGMPSVTDPAGLRAVAETGFAQARTDVALVPEEVEIAGDWAFARIRVEGTATLLDGGETIEIDMKELVVFRRQPDGSWRIARFMSNRNRES